MIFPSTVDLIKEPNETLKYFNRANKHYRKGRNVFYDLSKITRFSPESIALLAACVSSNHFTHGNSSRGNEPSNPFLSTMFRESGFFDHMSSNLRRYNSSKGNRLVHKVTNHKVIPSIARACCVSMFDKLTLTYHDELEPLFDILIEAMQNTNNHASAGKNVEYDWWLYEFDDRNKEIMHFTFLDIGSGIFESLPVKNYIYEVLKLLEIKSNLDLVDDLLAGKIKSRTKKPERGKGIPQIYELSKDGLFKDFHILSNDILINTKTDDRLELEEPFLGTLYYWTIPYSKSNGS